MISKKIGIVAAAVIVTVVFTSYGAIEMLPPTITRISGEAHYQDLTFEEMAYKAGIVLEGKIIGVKTKIFVEEMAGTDEQGNRVVFETLNIPRAEVTIRAMEVLKDDYGLESKIITVYDRDVPHAIGKVNGEKVRFVSPTAYDYRVGERGIFLIENDRGLWLDGFTSFYPIQEGKSTIESEFGKKYGKPSIGLEWARDAIRTEALGRQ